MAGRRSGISTTALAWRDRFKAKREQGQTWTWLPAKKRGANTSNIFFSFLRLADSQWSSLSDATPGGGQRATGAPFVKCLARTSCHWLKPRGASTHALLMEIRTVYMLGLKR